MTSLKLALLAAVALILATPLHTACDPGPRLAHPWGAGWRPNSAGLQLDDWNFNQGEAHD